MRLLPFKVLLVLTLFWHCSIVASPFFDPGPRITLYQEVSGQELYRLNRVIQDKQGFLWLASRTGLMRFDGYSVKNFTSDKANPSSLPHNFIHTLQQDNDGFIWIATKGGLSRFDPTSEQFTNFFHQDDDSALYSNLVNDISLDSNNRLWIATEGGINRIDTRTLKIDRLNEQLLTHEKAKSAKIRIIQIDAQQNLWFAVYRQGLFMFNNSIDQLSHFAAAENQEFALQSDVIQSIYSSNDGEIWIGGQFNTYRYDSTNSHFIRYPVPRHSKNRVKRSPVVDILKDSQGRVWIATLFDGVSVLDVGSDTFRNVNQGQGDEQKLSHSAVLDVFEDANGTLWFGSDWGLTKLNPKGLLFKQKQAIPGNRYHAQAIYTDANNNIWLSVGKNLYVAKGIEQPFTLAAENIGNIITILDNGDGRLLLNVRSVGPLIFDPKDGQWVEHAASNENLENLPSGNLRSMALDNQGNLWLGLYFHAMMPLSGLFKFDVEKKQYTHIINKITVENILPVDDKIIIGTKRKGIMVYDQATNAWLDVKNLSFANNQVRQLMQDKQGRIWFTTSDSGLGRFNLDTLSLDFITTNDGLPTNHIANIVQDQEGFLWLGTNKGITRYAPDNNHFLSFTVEHGLQLELARRRLSAMTHSGDIVIGGYNELVMFNPQQLAAKQAVKDFDILLSDFRLLNKPVRIQANDPQSPLLKPINYLQQMTLTYRDYLFSLRFATTDFSSSENARYAYRMYGYNNDWIETDSKLRMATFTSLPASDYQLQIRTTRSDGSWSEQYRTIDLTVTPPWYLSTAAYISYVLLIILAIYLYIKIRTQRLVKQAKALEQTVDIRTRELKQSRDQVAELLGQKERTFANISHEFKTPLTLILSPLESILNSEVVRSIPDEVNNKLSMMKRNGSRLLRMVEQMLELSRLDTATSQKDRHYSLKDTLNVLVTSFQPLIDSKSLTLHNADFDDVVLTLKVDSLEMILTNLISNAIKYTPKGGTIRIVTKPQGETVVISVSDTGMGISEENQKLVFNRFTRASEEHDENIPGAGIGLALVKELVETHDGTISLDSELNKGSTFTVTLPVNLAADVKPEVIEGLSSTSLNEIDALLGDSNKSPVPVTVASAAIDGDKATVLLIDDNADMLQLLTDTLHDHYDCITAPNGELGLELAKENIPDFIISDVMMPGISGYEVAKALKDDELTCHIPVILLTAKGDIDSRMEGWKQDIDDYLAKPFHPQELLLRIESLLSIRQILKKRFIQSVEGHDINGVQGPDSNNTPPAEPVISDKDHKFVERFKAVIGENYQDTEFSRDVCAGLMGISDRQLSRKISALMEDNFSEILRDFRLNQSLFLFKTGMQIGQISDEVGFSAIAYFSKCFKAKFGQTPKQYQKTVVL